MVYMSVGDSHHNQGNHGESSRLMSGGHCHESKRQKCFGFVHVRLIYRWVEGDWWGLYGGGGRRWRASNSRPLVWQRVSKQGLHACGLGSCLWSAPLSIKLLLKNSTWRLWSNQDSECLGFKLLQDVALFFVFFFVVFFPVKTYRCCLSHRRRGQRELWESQRSSQRTATHWWIGRGRRNQPTTQQEQETVGASTGADRWEQHRGGGRRLLGTNQHVDGRILLKVTRCSCAGVLFTL